MAADSPGERRGFRAFFASALRPKKSRQVLRKGGFSTSTPDLRPSTSSSSVYTAPGARFPDDDVPPMPSLAPLEAHRAKYRAINAGKDTQLGETRDPTAMLHALGVQELEHDPNAPDDMHDNRPPGEPDIASLSADLWQRIADELNPAGRASLIFASKTLLSRLGPGAWWALDEPDNTPYKGDFLASQDRHYPHHLLCFPCGVFHRRTQEGAERLQPAGTVNPLFDCPNARNSALPSPRHRITHGRVLYFVFVQLSMRAHRFGPRYGIPAETLSRRWRRDGWWHNTRYYIHRNHLLMRVVSSTFAEAGLTPSAQRMLLYSREDYWPYFSACAHWRDGELMNICKCALGHIPQSRATAGLQGLEHRAKDKYHGRTHNPNALTTLCGRCRPMRRCPECPSEYLVEVKLTEDRSDPRALRFRQAIVVTRWCDLGDGTSPHTSPEWSACNGENVDHPFDSFARFSKRSIAGTFEAAFTDDTLPGQRMLSLNPKGKKLGEEGTGWY